MDTVIIDMGLIELKWSNKRKPFKPKSILCQCKSYRRKLSEIDYAFLEINAVLLFLFSYIYANSGFDIKSFHCPSTMPKDEYQQVYKNCTMVKQDLNYTIKLHTELYSNSFLSSYESMIDEMKAVQSDYQKTLETQTNLKKQCLNAIVKNLFPELCLTCFNATILVAFNGFINKNLFIIAYEVYADRSFRFAFFSSLFLIVTLILLHFLIPDLYAKFFFFYYFESNTELYLFC